ncbi:MAG: EF-P lysine aminoacylase GenX [Deltaproteobacteria bacterium]|nr:EF-P lysine aminoacylase GenX [Deltaproteobacteria bacterium]
MRAAMIQALRRFFIHHGYLEVETPNRVATLAPEPHIDAVVSEGCYLHTSPELLMKRLLAAGYEKIFQITRCYRKAERGRLHLPEFTLLEWYDAGKDYRHLMDECEDLFLAVARDLGRGDSLSCDGVDISLKKPWERLSVAEAFRRYGGVSLEKALDLGRFDEIMVERIEPALGPQPLFLCDYPISRGALARRKAFDQTMVERFELYIGGLELANAFSELVDQEEQRDRFEQDSAERARQGKDPYPPQERFLEALAFMPEAAGIALGIDRMAMLFADKKSIDDVVAFTPEEL